MAIRARGAAVMERCPRMLSIDGWHHRQRVATNEPATDRRLPHRVIVTLTDEQLGRTAQKAAVLNGRRAGGWFDGTTEFAPGYNSDLDGRNLWPFRCELAAAVATGGA